MDDLRKVILFLNYIKINNLKIINFISEDKLQYFINVDELKILKLDFLTDKDKRKIIDGLNTLDINKEIDKLYIQNIKFVTILDDLYPNNLKNIYDPPAILYYQGEFLKVDDYILAIVGTRKPSNYGIWATNKIISDLSKYRVKIVSGMALGIDRQVHLSTIKYGLSSIGILASSIDIRYPKSNLDLYLKMNNHLLISEFPPNTNPIKRNFVFRNRIISGLAHATIVIEAQEESGSLITAKYALEQNRQIYAIPGNINQLNSEGTNRLIKNGAKLLSNVEDIVGDMDYIVETSNLNILNNFKKLDENELKILKALENSILSINDIIIRTEISIDNIYEILYILEEKNLISKLDNNTYVLN